MTDTRQRWEYLTVVWAQTAKRRAEGDGWDYVQAWQVSWPGTHDWDIRSERPAAHELGLDGWELVSETVTSSAIPGDGVQGYPDATMPIAMRWTYKRPLDE